MLKNSMLVFFVIICTLVGLPASGHETDTEEAKLLFEKAKKLYKQEKYSEAADTFRKSYETKPTWRLLYNIGQSEAAAKSYGMALVTFEKYLAEGGDEIPSDRQSEVRDEIRRLREMVGSLDIKAEAGITILVDGHERGETPLPGHVLVVSGVDHQVEAVADGEIFFDRKVRVSGGQTMVLEVPRPSIEGADATKESSEETEGELETEEDKPASALKTAGWVTLGIGGAVVVGGVVTGAMALSKNSKIEEACGGTTCPPGEDSSLEKDRDKMALITDILLPVGGVIAATGITLLIIHAVKNKEVGEGTEVSARLQPIAGPGIAGFMVQGRF